MTYLFSNLGTKFNFDFIIALNKFKNVSVKVSN